MQCLVRMRDDVLLLHTELALDNNRPFATVGHVTNTF